MAVHRGVDRLPVARWGHGPRAAQDCGRRATPEETGGKPLPVNSAGWRRLFWRFPSSVPPALKPTTQAFNTISALKHVPW